MVAPPEPSALFLAEQIGGLNDGASFLQRLAPAEIDRLRARGASVTKTKGDAVFLQGDPHDGIWLIERGRLRTHYVSPAGREITLAFWTAGHFVGGPEVFGGGRHVWSCDTVEPAQLLKLQGETIRALIEEMPSFAICLIEGLVAKGKCYSALVQMLGTRSVSERLQHLLTIMVELYAVERADGVLVIERSITFDQIAAIVGATRQWVSTSLDRLQKRGVLEMTRQEIRILNLDGLRASE